MKDPMVLVLDCGATNVRVIAVNKIGELVHAERDQNGPGTRTQAWDTHLNSSLLNRYLFRLVDSKAAPL